MRCLKIPQYGEFMPVMVTAPPDGLYDLVNAAQKMGCHFVAYLQEQWYLITGKADDGAAQPFSTTLQIPGLACIGAGSDELNVLLKKCHH